MANMAFGVLCVRDFLAANGHVLTVRGYDYRTGSATVRDLNDIRISRKKVCEILTENELAGFVPLSGFKTAAAWMKQIKRFCKGRMWLYRVCIDDDDISKQERDYETREHRKPNNLIDEAPGFVVDRNAYRDEKDPTTIEEYNVYDDMSHALDIRGTASLRDPALVDLTASRAQAHRDRIDADDRAAERKRDRMRARYGV